MNLPVQSSSLPLTHTKLLGAFRAYLTTLALSATSRKLYLADLSRFLAHLSPDHLPLSRLQDPSTYQAYLREPAFTSSPTLLRRTLASLRQFGVFLSHTYDLPSPTANLTVSLNAPYSPLGDSADKYIRTFTNYLKELHLENQSIKSYKSDVTQFLTYLLSHHPSTHVSQLLNEKNLQIYTAEIAHSLTQSPATIARKAKTIRRFLAWFAQQAPRVILSDNQNISASTLPTPLLSPHTSADHTPTASIPTPAESLAKPSPDVRPNRVKNRNYRKFLPNLGWTPSLRSILTLSTLLVVTATLAILTYRQFANSASLTQAVFPDTPTTPNRRLSFQGRLENASGTPIEDPIDMVFKLYDEAGVGLPPSGGTELYSTSTCSIDPDTDGVFSTQIGGTCGASIDSTVFTEHSNVWLEVTVDSQVLGPRQQIATVAYALNSETLQGFPISATISAIRNTVVPMNQWGEIIIGEQSPRLKGVAGTLQISAPALSLITAAGTNGNIAIAPDGTGQVNVTGNTTTTNFFNVSNAQLTTGSLITGTVANDNSGFKLLDLLSGSSPSSKFSVDSAGNTQLAGTLTLPNSNTLTGVANYTQFSQGISVGGGTTYYLNSSGTANLNALTLAGTLDANGTVDLGDGGDTITLNGSSVTLTGFNCSGNTNGGALTTNGSGVLQCSDDDGGGGSGSGSNWRSNLGTLSPLNDTWDLLVGGNATSSAKAGFVNINSGTPTATVSAGTAGAATLTATGVLGTTAMQSLTLGNSTTGNIVLAPGGNPIFTASGNLITANSHLSVNGNTVLGDSIADTLTFNARVAQDSDLIPVGTTGTNDLGSSSLPWDNLYVNSLTLPSFTQGSVIFAGASGVLSQDNSSFYFDDTNNRLGLGLTNPLATLDIAGSASASGTLTFRGTTDPKLNILNGENFGLQFSPGGDAGLTERLTVLNNGNVGIGVTNPTNKLEIGGTTSTISNSSGDLTIDSFTGNVVFGTDDDLIPTLGAGSADLGSSSLPWDNLFVSDLDFSGAASTITLRDNTTSALRILEGANVYFDITTTDNTESFTLNLPTGGGTSQTANLFTSNIAKTINLGTGTAADTINIGTGGTTADDINLGGLSTSHVDITGTLNLAGGTTYYVDSSGNAKFLDLQVADTANPGLTVGNGSIGYAKLGSSTIYDNNSSYLSFDPDSDSSDEMQLTNDGQIQLPTTGSTGGLRLGGDVDLYRSAANELKVDDSATVSANLMVGGQLQLGRFASTPTAIGTGTMIFNTTTNNFECYNGSNWYNCGSTLYSNTNASVADGSYITVTHNLANTDLLSSAWINSQGVWKTLDASYRPAIAWEGKDTQKGVYHNAVNSYIPGNETGSSISTLHDGLIFDTFEDTTKTDSANTTVSRNSQLGDDGSRNYTTLDQRVQGGRVGLLGGQIYATSTTDNDGQTYLGSNTVNDIYYYDRSKDSTPEVLVELGIDPNWYNGVTLSVATSSANYAHSGTLADKNPNLTPTYNGSLIKATGTDSTPRTIYITIKSPTTFDWTNYQGDSATGVTITPGTAQTLGSTGVSATFTATSYNVGDVFRIASWYIEAEGTNRGAKQQFPERSYIVATASSVDIIDADTQKLWIRFSQNASGYMIGVDTNNNPSAVQGLNGSVYVTENGSSATGLYSLNFVGDSAARTNATNVSKSDSSLALRNSANTYSAVNTSNTLVTVTGNDVAAAVIPNAPTHEITVSGWGYQSAIAASGQVMSESVNLPFKFNSPPIVKINIAGHVNGSDPQSLSSCVGLNDSLHAYTGAQTDRSFSALAYSSAGTWTGYRICYTWTATGTVSPKQFVAVATGATSNDGGTTIINETDSTEADILVGSLTSDAIWQNKVAIAGNTLYSASNTDATTDSTYLDTYDYIHSLQTETTWAQYFNEAYQVGATCSNSCVGSVLGTSTSYNQVTSLYATANTSSNNANSNTIYVGTPSGVSVINEYQDGSNGQDANSAAQPSSVKYYTKDYISEEMIGDIRGMWPLNNSNGSSDIEDVSIKANALSATNITAAGDSISGVRGTATDFDGSSEYLSIPDNASLSLTGSASYGAWVKLDSLADNQQILIKRHSATNFPSLMVGRDTTTGYGTTGQWNFSNAPSACGIAATAVGFDTNWHFLVGTYDGTNQKLYVDGQLAVTDPCTTAIDTDGAFQIGAGRYNTSTANYLNGAIDEVFVTATALTETQIRNMYQVGYRALQSHGTDLGGGSADMNQQLFDQYSGSGSSNVGVAIPDWNNQYMYVGINSSTDGAVYRVQLNSDTNIKTYVSRGSSPFDSNTPTGGIQLIDREVSALGVSYVLEAVGSATGGIQSMGIDDTLGLSGNFVSKTYALPKNIGSAVIWASPVLDSSDVSNTLTVQASNDGGSNYVTCTVLGTDSNPTVPEREYACTFSTADNDLKLRFQFARGSEKTNTYLVQYGISWLGETGFRVEQADNNNVRLYNFSGESQNLKLNVTGAGTSALANPWTDGGSYLFPTGYETLRIYDGSGTNYLGLSHDGTLANLTYNGSTVLSLNSTGDLLPNTDDTQSLGSTTKRWKDLFLGGETMHIGTSLTDEGTISYTTSTNLLNFSTDSTSNGDIAFFTDDLYLDKSTGFVGIGDTTPDYTFDVAGSAGFDSTVTLTGSAANIALGSNYLSGDGGDEGIYVDSSGNVGIGTASPGVPLEIRTTSATVPFRIYNNNLDSTEYWSVGPAASDNFVVFNESSTGMYIAHGATAWTANSDERLKTNITPISNIEGLEALLELHPVDYNWKDVNTSQSKQTGFIAQEVQRLFPGLISLGETTTITLADGSTETIETPLGINYTGFIPYIIKGIQEQQQQINNLLTSSFTSLSNLISPSIQTATISPLAEGQSITLTAPVTITPTTPELDLPALIVDGTVEATTISARLAKLTDLQAQNITAQNIVADTISANSIVGLDAKLATLSAGLSDSEFDSITARIKARLAQLTQTPTAEDLPTPVEASSSADTTASLNSSDPASASATLAVADIDFATINQYLAVIGQATITSLDITSNLYTDRLDSKSGLLALGENTLIIDQSGTVAINGNLVVSGNILASSAQLDSLTLGAPTPASSSSSLGNLLAIYNESGSAVATIDASGSANLASLTTNMITIASSSTASESSALNHLVGNTSSNATAGQSTLLSPNTELTINSPYVTPNSLVYLTPTTNTDNKVLFVQSKVTCSPETLALDPSCTPSFTVGIDTPASSDISFNWWIIELAPQPEPILEP